MILRTGLALLAVLTLLPAARAADRLPGTLSQGVWQIPAGRHTGHFLIDKPVQLRCADGAILDAGGSGHTLEISAPDVTVEGCRIENWGHDLTALNAGIFIRKQASGARILNNRFKGPGFGIWADGTRDIEIAFNQLEGDLNYRSQDRGNGIHLFAVHNANVHHNEVWHTRDGIYIDTANGNRLTDNFMHDLRYGVHYMYSHDNTVARNRTTRTRTGYALMQSRRLQVIGNRSEQDRNYGILMNFITDSTLKGNVIIGVRAGQTGGVSIQGGEGKGFFVYNSVFNTFEGNRVEDWDIGIHLTAGSEDNRVFGNAFIGNAHQVKYVATRPQSWAENGRGNYWSDYLGWDRNGDGIGDVPYAPNDRIDKLLWRIPQARILMHSPAVDTLRWAQRAFPVLKPQGVEDPAPLMTPPEGG